MPQSDRSELGRALADLQERVAALEAGGRGRQAPRAHSLDLAQSMLDDLPEGEGATTQGKVVFAGAGHRDDGSIVWQVIRAWDDVLGHDPTPLALVLAALGNPLRIQIIQMLIGGPMSTSELVDALEAPSSGQLFHHLKELLAAGLIHQPSRGLYDAKPERVVPLLAALSAAADLAVPTIHPDPEPR